MRLAANTTASARLNAPRALLPAICSAAFVVFAQTFMVAPLIPRLSVVFASPITWVALAIPAFIVPQGLMTLLAGPLSDRIGRREVIYASLLLFVAITAATATANPPKLRAVLSVTDRLQVRTLCVVSFANSGASRSTMPIRRVSSACSPWAIVSTS